MTDTVPSIAVLADDLSGAAEVAGAFLGRDVPLSLRLNALQALASPGVTVADLNTRMMSPGDAAATVRAALANISAGALVMKKVDSLLRGHIRAEVAALAERGPVIVALALPVLGRTVRNGVLYIGDTPLHETAAWAAEPAPPPLAVADLFPDLAGSGRITVYDAETDADLDAIVSAAPAGSQLVGTSALAAAVARTLPVRRSDADHDPQSKTVLTVVGTVAPVAAGQVEALVAGGARPITVDARALLHDKADIEPVQRALGRGSAVVTIGGVVDPAEGQAISAALGHFIAQAEAGLRPDLVLTGGETARSVVDAIGLTALHPVHEIHHGAVASVASDGRRVVTRPGSFGTANSLVDIVRYLTQPREDNS
jgi:uncharacterized protein YgbK (DUF1537 family)